MFTQNNANGAQGQQIADGGIGNQTQNNYGAAVGWSDAKALTDNSQALIALDELKGASEQDELSDADLSIAERAIDTIKEYAPDALQVSKTIIETMGPPPIGKVAGTLLGLLAKRLD